MTAPSSLHPSRRVLLSILTVLSVAASLVALSMKGQAAYAAVYQDPSQSVSARVDDLMSRMSIDDKVGQMTQADRAALSTQSDLATYRIGSVLSGGDSGPANTGASGWADMYDNLQRIAIGTPLGIPMIYGIDAVHGHNAVSGATVFPHNIGLGATRDPDLVQRVGQVTAEEVTGTGIDWTFAPCLCVARNDRWGRTYESYGEVPEIGTALTTIVTGLQGSTLGGPTSVLATAKHYVGDGGTTNGTDQGNTQLSESELRAIHLPPFKAAIDRNVGSVMISFSSWNGAKMHGNRYLITDVLKTELGFKGFVVTDWAGIDQLDGATGFTQAEVVSAINAGIDMVMVPTNYKLFIQYLKAAVSAGQIAMSRIDDANRRILTKKFELGLFERPLTDRTYTSTVGSAAHRAVAREAVRKSQVLLKNSNSVLPLAKTGKIFVAGKNADNVGNQAGGWTLGWQGRSGTVPGGTSILAGIRSVAPGATVTYSSTGSGIDSSYKVAVAVLGETPYAEGRGDRTGSMGLDSTDLTTLNNLKAAGVPIVVVLVSGRPMDIAAQVNDWSGLIAAWLPGTEGQGVADVLFGDYNPTGKLPMTWMQSVSQQPINDGDGKAALFPLGYGLSYSVNPPPTTPPTTAPTTPPTTRPTTAPTTAPTTTRPTTAPTTVPTTTRPTTAPTTTQPTTAPTTAPTTPPPTSSSSGCTATYRLVNSWQGGFQGEVTVRNNGTATLNGWTVTWTLPSGQSISQVWNGTLSLSGTAVTVKNVSWNGAIGASGSTTFGFLGAGDSSVIPTLTCSSP